MTAPAAPRTAPPADLHAELLDCLQVNLAWLARSQYDVSPLALGARLPFAPRDAGPGALPTVEPATEAHVEHTAGALGLRITSRHAVPPRTGTPPADSGTVYVIADAYHLPWVPYHGHTHMEHSFLLGRDPSGRALVCDGYHNDTAYGPARPGTWTLTEEELAAALPDGALALGTARTAVTRDADTAGPAAPAAVETYVRAYREHPDREAALAQLTLETWLLARSRRLHAAYLATTGPLAPAVEEHLTAWGRLTEQTFLAHRRLQRGRPEPAGPLDRLAELLLADARVFAQPLPGPEAGPAATAGTPDAVSADPGALRTAVAEEAAAVLRADAADLLAGTPLTEVPGFGSFRMVDIVERIEERLGIEFDAADLVPENLHDLDGLCRIAARAHRETP